MIMVPGCMIRNWAVGITDTFAEKYISWPDDNYVLNKPLLLIDPDVVDSHAPNTLDCEIGVYNK
jgi:hypothetical protein